MSEALYLRDPDDNGVELYCDRAKGMSQFLDDKSYRPGFGPYARTS